VKSLISKKLVAGVTGLAVLGGAGAAIAATQGSTTQSSNSSGSQALISDLAGRLNVTPTALVAAVKAAATDQINAAVAAGRLTQAQGTAAEHRIAQSTGVSFGRGFAGGGFARGGFSGGGGQIDATAAQYLGISETTLRSDLKAGHSLATIATSTTGKSVTGLKAAIIAAETTRLNSAVSIAKITQAQETRRLADLSSRIDSMLQRTETSGSNGWSAHDGGRTRRSS
jgi:hypothetical protein